MYACVRTAPAVFHDGLYMTVSLVIPHWNRSDLLERVLHSVRAQSLPPGVSTEVLVVDNASQDDSCAVAGRHGARVIALAVNEGVSRALNRGIAASQGDCIVLLNNDVELTPTWLRELLDSVLRQDAWFATGKVLNAAFPERVDGAGDAVCRGGTAWRLGNGKADGSAFDSPRKTYFPSATAALFRREFFDRVGPLEESFYAYLEDVDLGMRAASAGLPGIYAPGAVAFHRGSATTGAWSKQSVAWITRHQILLLAKYYSARLFVRFWLPILVAQLLWVALAVSRGQAGAWLRGAAGGMRAALSVRRSGRSLRTDSRRLASALEESEAEIGGIQSRTGWDTYWKWYFRLAFPPVRGAA